MNTPPKPKNFPQAIGMLFKAYQKYNTPEAQRKWKEDMYAHRWKNLGWSTVFITVTIAFLWFGNNFKSGFYTPIHWYIFMGLASVFLLIGMWTWVGYVKLIIGGKKNN